MGTTAEKLVKQAIKLIAKIQEVDYDDLKGVCKKVVKSARKFDESLLGMMEELLDLGNVGSLEELDEFDIEVLKIYCRIKELDMEGSDKSIKNRVWKNIEEEFILDEESETDNSDSDEDEDETDNLVEIEEGSENELEPATPPPKEVDREIVFTPPKKSKQRK
jgi:hypothetical protein